MSSRAPLFFFLLLSAFAALAAVPESIRARLREAGMPDDALAFVAQRASDGRTVASHQPGKPIQPASTLKVLTSLVALEKLGPAYTGRSVLLAAGRVSDGVLHGDLVLRGEGDVDLDAPAFERMLRIARMAGIRDIRGDLVLDRTFFDPARTDVGVPPFDQQPEFRYNVIPDALPLNMNLLELELAAGHDDVRAAAITPLEGVSVKSELTAADGDCDSWDDGWKIPEVRAVSRGRLEVRLHGTFPRDCRVSTAINVIERVDFAERLFRALWGRLGGTFRGHARDGPAPAGARVLARHRSRPLSEFVHDIGKASDNPVTRVTYLALGAASPGEGRPTAQRAEASMREWMASKGIDDSGLVLENGSGLSRLERISPAQLAAVLRAAQQSPWFPEFMASLPIVGVDGLRTRFRGTNAVRSSRLKTGTLRNASGLAGYVKDREGTTHVVVAIINDEAARPEIARPILDALIEWLLATGFAGSPP